MADPVLTVYTSSISGSQEVKKQQQKILMVLKGKKIPFEEVDIAMDVEERDKMREIAGKEDARAPQITSGDQYCGGYDDFEAAIEEERLEEFLKLK